jgi:hypothetical protein
MASGARALPDLIAKIRLDSSGLDQGINALVGNFSKANIAVGAAAAGLSAVVGIAVEAEHKYMDLAESVHSYMAVTGESAAIASAQVQAFRELGVSEDVAQAAMVKLSKAIEGTPKKLADLGVEIATTAKGNVDLNATLLNVIDTWNGTEDAAKRNQIALIAFGRNGVQAMLPILEAGSDALRKLEADVRITMTDADIAQAHKYSLAQKEQKVNFDAMQESIGQDLLPYFAKLTDSYNENEFVMRHLTNAQRAQLAAVYNSPAAYDQLLAKLRAEWEASNAAKGKLLELTDAHDQASAAAAAQAKALDDLYNAEEASTNATVAAERANLHFTESQDKLNKAQDKLNKAIHDYGANSDEARSAADDLANTLLDQKSSALEAAAAAQKLQEDLDLQTTGVKNVAVETGAYITKLQEEANSLAPGSSLRVFLEQYIGRLQAIPSQINTNFTTTGDSSSSRGNLRAAGGPVVPGRTYTVGEEGIETLVMGASGGYVVPNGGRRGGSSSDSSAGNAEVVGLLSDILGVLTSDPGGRTGVEAALYKAVQGSALNRARGMAGS